MSAQGQYSILFRRFPMGAGLSNMNLKHDLDIVYNFVESLRGDNGLLVLKSDDGSAVIDSDGASSSTALSDYTEREEAVVDIRVDPESAAVQIKTGTILIKDESESEWTTILSFPPPGWEIETLDVVTAGKIVKRTVLVKSDTATETNKVDVETWSISKNRELLQVGAGGKLTIDKGFFKP